MKTLLRFLHGGLLTMGIIMIVTIVLGLAGVFDDEPPQVEFTHSVEMERHHFKANVWVVLWTIDGHWFIQHPDGFQHHPGCPFGTPEP